jgi:electron transfer flavoprotein alpha subunit
MPVSFKDKEKKMENVYGPVWVIAEQRECSIRGVSLQLMGRACELAGQLGANAEALLLGAHMQDRLSPLLAAGADRVYLCDHPLLERYEPELFVEIIVKLALEHQPEIILVGSTAMGRELAPLLAARLKTGLTAHCIDLRLNAENILEQFIPAYGGMLSIICPQQRPQMATVAKGVFPLPPTEESNDGEVVAVNLPDDFQRRLRTLEVVTETPEAVSLDSAECVVAGGAGAGDEDGWRQITALATALGAALGCTRPAVDEGWAPLDTMIGQSGRMVSPELYIGVGLSGEQQHMVGISGAKIMVAINSDEKSPVFDQVDIGVVADCRTFLPLLIEKITDLKEKQATC